MCYRNELNAKRAKGESKQAGRNIGDRALEFKLLGLSKQRMDNSTKDNTLDGPQGAN